MNGDPVEFEFISANATASAPIVIREPGNPAERVLKPGERFILQEAVMFAVGGATQTLDMFTDATGTGSLAANELMVRVGEGTHPIDFTGTGEGMAGARGVIPRMIAANAGNVSIVGSGVIVRS